MRKNNKSEDLDVECEVPTIDVDYQRNYMVEEERRQRLSIVLACPGMAIERMDKLWTWVQSGEVKK